MINGEPWFLAKDACDVLELSNPTKTLLRLDEDEKGLTSIQSLGGLQETNIVNKYGLYNLVLGSRKPEAKFFKRWITHDVIPSIRKTGSYFVEALQPKPMSPEEMIIAQAQSVLALKGEVAILGQTIGEQGKVIDIITIH